MTDRELLSAVHPAVLLLPTFLNGTLSEEEHREVAAHLADCAQCRRELDECVRLREGLRQMYAAQPGPSPALFSAVMEQVKREKARTWIGRLDDRLRSLLSMPWAPSFALALVIAQLGLLVWTSQYGERGASEVVTRSVPAQSVQLRVAFQAAATNREVQSLLREIRGRIVDGPTAAGLYTVEVPLGGDATVERYLKLLRARPEVVRSAEPLAQ
jgi:anti-sigma factor RsiW